MAIFATQEAPRRVHGMSRNLPVVGASFPPSRRHLVIELMGVRLISHHQQQQPHRQVTECIEHFDMPLR